MSTEKRFLSNFSEDDQISDVLAKNLRHLMHVRKIDSAMLSKETGIAVSTVNALRRGTGNPTLSTLSDLAKIFKISIGTLTEKELSSENKENTKIYEIPLLDLSEIENFLKNKMRLSKKIISVELENSVELKNIFCIKIKNNSMTPFFAKNTIFVIANEENVYDGDMALVKFGDNFPCFRQVYMEGESYFFKTVSDKLDKKTFTSPEFKIIGIVIKAIQTLTER